MRWNSNLIFSTLEEVREFENDLAKYQLSMDLPPFQWLCLAGVWETLVITNTGRKIFASCLDLRLNVVCLEVLLARLMNTSTRLKGNTDERVAVAFERYEINSSYIVRYRAVYDKLMGLWILLLAPDSYDSYCSAKSRKKKFVSILSKISAEGGQFAVHISKSIGDFDDKYRTQEVHGTGTVRKWSFELSEGPESHQADMYWAWNMLHPLLTATADLLTKSEYS